MRESFIVFFAKFEKVGKKGNFLGDDDDKTANIASFALLTFDHLPQVGYFVGGVASLESGELAGLAATFAVVAVLALTFMVALVLRTRVAGGRTYGWQACCVNADGRGKGANHEQSNGSVRQVCNINSCGA